MTQAFPSDAALHALRATRSRTPFVWGVATSSFQIEGATTDGGRGESIWDRFCATPGKVRNGDTGMPACDHYHRMPGDVAVMKSLGVDGYRFSIAWPRVQPAGSGAWNPAGLAFYDRLVDQLLTAGIQPHATLFHWDLPQGLQEGGGWLARSTAERFAEYAVKMGQLLGGRLASLSTHNEPWCSMVLGHATGQFAPGMKDPVAAVAAGHHLLLSHGLAMQAMRAAGVACPLGIVLNQSSATAATSSPADKLLAEQQYTSLVRWFLDPVLLGRYPEVEGVAIPQGALVHDGDMALIQAPIDFLGINYYTRIWGSADKTPPPNELGVTDMGWEIYPDGLRELLTGLMQAGYPLPPIYITENGCACADVLVNGAVDDSARIDYLRRHLEALAEARAAGVDIRGYFAWSLMDNFEWDSGYAKRFGLVHVDYATQVRTPKASALWYRDMIARFKAGASNA